MDDNKQEAQESEEGGGGGGRWEEVKSFSKSRCDTETSAVETNID